MIEVKLTPSANAQLRKLKDNAATRQLYERVCDYLDLLEDDPGCREVRRRRFAVTDLWGIPVHGSGQELLILWRQVERELIVVSYIEADFELR